MTYVGFATPYNSVTLSDFQKLKLNVGTRACFEGRGEFPTTCPKAQATNLPFLELKFGWRVPKTLTGKCQSR